MRCFNAKILKAIFLLCSFNIYGNHWTGKLYYKFQGKDYIGGYYTITSTSKQTFSIKLETPGSTATFVTTSKTEKLNFTNKQFIRNKFIPELTHNYYWTITINNTKPNIYCYAESFLSSASGNYRLSPKTFYFFTKES